LQIIKGMSTSCTETERRVLKQLGLLVDQAMDLDLVLDSVLEILMQGLPGQRCEITLQDPPSGRLSTRSLQGAAIGLRGQSDGDPVQILAARVMQDASPYFGLGPLCAVPLYRNTVPAGALSMESAGIVSGEAKRVLSAAGEMLSRLLKLHRHIQARLEPVLRRPPASAGDGHLLLEGQGQKMAEVRRLLYKVAPSETPVFLSGPLGSGKAQAARLIHQLSPRAELPLARINCQALSQQSLARGLFGLEGGAHDPASRAKAGLLQKAKAGCLFLDEIDNLGLPLQAKLLTLLQEHYYEPMGGGQPIICKVRILAASRGDLARAVERGDFRQDLYYRLNVFPITLPPLSQRRGDIGLLAEFFLARASADRGRPVRLSLQAATVLTHYAWPGNAAELDNLCQRLALLAPGREITLEDLPSFVFQHEPRLAAGRAGSWSRLEEMERGEVMAALQRNHWVQSHAAAELGLTLRQIGYRVKKFGLDQAIQLGRSGGPSPGN
jgi:Nif-specific regulatory protein